MYLYPYNIHDNNNNKQLINNLLKVIYMFRILQSKICLQIQKPEYKQNHREHRYTLKTYLFQHGAMTVNNSFSKSQKSIRNRSVSLSLTLSRNEKVDQHIKKFWIEGGVIFLCEFDSILILVCLST